MSSPREIGKLITKRGSQYGFLVFVSTLVILMGPWAGCAAPEAMPTATRAPTLTPTPTPMLVPQVTLELAGRVDNAGILLEDVEVISGDGVATLHLAQGTKVLDASGQPLNSITVTATRPPARSSARDRYLSRLAYDFSPAGARIDPRARLSIRYDPARIIPEADESSAHIGYFEEAGSTWTWLDVTRDLDNHTVTAAIDQLGTFVVSFQMLYLLPMPIS